MQNKHLAQTKHNSPNLSKRKTTRMKESLGSILFDFLEVNYAGLIASEGHTSAQVPQSVHTSASIT